ncbi:MAG TPA: aminoglycoside phosphotransferase family protein [Anaerolineales bacterium]|nr:aminoglycoside phosphotransferase family protein [Anaerolineales bacterium]
MNLPPDFLSNIQNVFEEDGTAFLKALPDLIAEASARWGLTDVEPVSNLSFNFVAFANRPSTALPIGRSAQDERVVLKIGVRNDELISEMAAMRLFDGDGACRLIDSDEERGFLLLERLTPGVMLSTLKDDEQATHIAAEVMQKIWRDLEPGSLLPNTRQQAVGLQNKFIRLSDWFDGLKKLRAKFNGGTGPFDKNLVERVEQSVRDFFIENHKPVLMHGDFHHFNILSSERGWLVIDAKGVIGPAGYEVGPFLINPWGDMLNGIRQKRMTERRFDILHEHLGFERERIREWGLAHAVLSAWWDIEDNTGRGEYALDFAAMLADIPLHS